MLEKEIEFKFGQKYANVKGDDAFKVAKITSIENEKSDEIDALNALKKWKKIKEKKESKRYYRKSWWNI